MGQVGGHSAGITTLTSVLKSTAWTTPVAERRTRIAGGGAVVLDQPVQTAACTTGGIKTAGSHTIAASRAAAVSRRIPGRYAGRRALPGWWRTPRSPPRSLKITSRGKEAGHIEDEIGRIARGRHIRGAQGAA